MPSAQGLSGEFIENSFKESAYSNYFDKISFENIVSNNCSNGAKGQLISKANLLVLIWTKNPTKLFLDFCPSL